MGIFESLLLWYKIFYFICISSMKYRFLVINISTYHTGPRMVYITCMKTQHRIHKGGENIIMYMKKEWMTNTRSFPAYGHPTQDNVYLPYLIHCFNRKLRRLSGGTHLMDHLWFTNLLHPDHHLGHYSSVQSDSCPQAFQKTYPDTICILHVSFPIGVFL